MNARNITFDQDGLLCGVLPYPYPATLRTIFPIRRYAAGFHA